MLISSRNLSLAAVLASATMVLSACQVAPPAASLPAAGGAATLASAGVVRQDTIPGAYELAYDPAGQSLYVAATSSFEPGHGGRVYRLDARTLQTLQAIQIDRLSFALGLNRQTGLLYVGNTMDGSLTVVDVNSGMVQGVIQLAQPTTDADGQPEIAHTRKVLVDEKHNRIFVTSPGKPGTIWIIDGATGQLRHTIASSGIWTAGAAYDDVANRLYVSQGGTHEILAIDPDAGQIVASYSTGDSSDNTPAGSRHFFINLALDTQGQRLFSTDANSGSVYVFDIASGQQLRRIPVEGASLLDIVFNPQRNEFVTTHRGVSEAQPSGTGAVTVFDATTYAVKKVIDLPVHPNSLVLTPDGQTLYVSVKMPHGDRHPAARKDALDSVVRIDLRTLD